MSKRRIIGQVFENLPPELGIRNYPGYMGAFTRNEAKGAIPNGTVIVKVAEEDDDRTPLGTEGIVLGSLYAPDINASPMYFVEWANNPKIAISIIGWKIAKKP